MYVCIINLDLSSLGHTDANSQLYCVNDVGLIRIHPYNGEKLSKNLVLRCELHECYNFFYDFTECILVLINE